MEDITMCTQTLLTQILGIGLAMDIRNCVTADQKFVSLWHQICDKQDADEREWVAGLRAAGFKAAHPNDGWVNRKDCEMYFAYPQFNDGAVIGDIVMLGCPFDKQSWRPVRLIDMRVTAIGKMVWWKFEDMSNAALTGGESGRVEGTVMQQEE